MEQRKSEARDQLEEGSAAERRGEPHHYCFTLLSRSPAVIVVARCAHGTNYSDTCFLRFISVIVMNKVGGHFFAGKPGAGKPVKFLLKFPHLNKWFLVKNGKCFINIDMSYLKGN